MGVSGFLRSMGICGCHGYLWQFMGRYECLWIFMSVSVMKAYSKFARFLSFSKF